MRREPNPGGHEFADYGEGLDSPRFRVVVRGAKLRAVPWSHRLFSRERVVEARVNMPRGVLVCDVFMTGDDAEARELFVRPLSGPVTASCRWVLLTWARAVGVERVWLDDRMVELSGRWPTSRAASIECEGCGLRLTGYDPEWWISVREIGAYPNFCPACGTSLHQCWEAER